MGQKIVVIGGGASGFMAAITAAKEGALVTILEQNSKFGKKILATGNGKCNLTNLDQKEEYYRSNTPKFSNHALENFTVSDTIAFFHEIGLYTKDKNGYLYPYSEQAASVVELFELEARRLKVKLKTNEKVIRVEPMDKASSEHFDKNGKEEQKEHRFLVHTTSWQYPCDRVILCCGSSASAIEGCDGSGYDLAKSFGHSIVRPLPALTGLKCAGNQFSKWAGVRIEASLVLQISSSNTTSKEFEQSEYSQKGELQLTEYGISGIPVFQLSRYAARALADGSKVHAILDFMPSMTKEQCEAFLKMRLETRPGKTMKEQLIGIFPAKLIDVFFGNKKPSKVSLETLVHTIKHYELDIKDTLDLAHAQVCTGGISCKEVNPKTMESLLVPDVYFCGELLDVDGTCGGYNLQWAWSSGYLAGQSAAKRK